MPSDSSLEAWFQMGQSAQKAGDQFAQMAEMAKRVAALQVELDRITKINETYVIQEMEP